MAFTSPAPESVLEILASSNLDDTERLLPLPPNFIESDSGFTPLIYAPYAPYFDILQEALDTIDDFIAHPPTLQDRLLQPVNMVLGYFGLPHISTPVGEIKEIEVVGHGLGSIVALLSTLRLHENHPNILIRTTLFSMPRIGDVQFAQYVNDILVKSEELEIQRVTYGRDPLPSLPPPHYGLVHPSSIREVLLEAGESEKEGMKGKLIDGLGPYRGQTIGRT
jgi:hypothetical protein